LAETDFYTALYLCREIRRHLEELSEEREDKMPEKNEIIRGLEGYLGMKLEYTIAALRGLEKSIETQDSASMQEYETLIDALVDFLDRQIDAIERSMPARPRGMPMQRLKAMEQSAGKLAQLLCQID
jgi:hypothetical protein